MNNFTKRIIFGLLYAGLVVSSSVLGAVFFYSLFLVFMMICIYEFIRIIELVKLFFRISIFVFSHKIILSIFIMLVYFTFILALVSSRKIGRQYLGKNFLTLMYIAIPFSLLIKIPYLNFEGSFDTSIIIGIFILIWSNDVFAFLIGKNFGKHKLIERVSPNKTVEGFLGGFIFTFVAGYFVAKYCPSIQPVQWFTIAIIVSIFGVFGDLIESMFKRQAKIKDSSNLLPGHGGFLDRLDSIIFATPFVFIYLFLTT